MFRPARASTVLKFLCIATVGYLTIPGVSAESTQIAPDHKQTYRLPHPGEIVECDGHIYALVGSADLIAITDPDSATVASEQELSAWYSKILSMLFQRWKLRAADDGQGQVEITIDANGIKVIGKAVPNSSERHPFFGTNQGVAAAAAAADIDTFASVLVGTVESSVDQSIELPKGLRQVSTKITFARDAKEFPRSKIEGIRHHYVVLNHDLVCDGAVRLGFNDTHAARLSDLLGPVGDLGPVLPVNFSDVKNSPMAATRHNADKSIWVDAPIYFASDRRPSEHQIKNHYTQFGNDQLVGQLYGQFGVAHVALKLPEELANDSQLLSSLGYRKILQSATSSKYYSDLDSQLLLTAPGISVSMGAQPKAVPWDFVPQWLDHFALALSRASAPSVPLYVHGCCVSRRASFQQAAMLQLYLRSPVILFDWATVGTLDAPFVPELNAYRRSERAMDISRVNLRSLTEQLVKRFGSERIDLFGHSMGCRLLTDLLGDAALPVRYGQVHFVRPDLNLQSYLMDENRIAAHCGKLFVYCADNDPWLIHSQPVSGGIPRLGCVGPLVTLVKQTGGDRANSAVFLNVASLNVGHDPPYAAMGQIYQHDLEPSRFKMLHEVQGSDRFIDVQGKEDRP